MADYSNAFNKSMVATYNYSSSHMNKRNTMYKLVDNNILLNRLHCVMITVDEAGSNPLSRTNFRQNLYSFTHSFINFSTLINKMRPKYWLIL